MALAPKFSSRRVDVLQKRIDEIEVQKRSGEQRARIYETLHQQSELERVTNVHAQQVHDRLHHAFYSPNGAELRAHLLEQIANLPPTSSGIATKPFQAKIGIISDLFLYKSFDGLADFRPILPDNYSQHVDIDILLVVSTWRGIDNRSWAGLSGKRHLKRRLFEEIIPFFRDRGVAIVFYSKEDPPNYERFLPFAQHADYIFTSAAEMIPAYERDCPNALSINVLPFGINPKNHSPIGSQNGQIQSVIPFAGSWFNHKYDQRSRWGGQLLDAVTASQYYNLLIFDRNSHIDNAKYRFPHRYARSLTSSIDHERLLDIQRVVDLSINLNSVQESESMFANRVIELQAQGTFVLSNYNVGVNSKYPNVHIVNSFLDTLGCLDAYTEKQIRETQAAGIRSVYSNDLAIMRVAKIIETVGVKADVPDPQVAVIKHNDDEQLRADISGQTYPHILEVIDVSDDRSLKEVRERNDVLVHMDTKFKYASTHVEDLVNAFRYTDARRVEKISPSVTHTQFSFQRHSYAETENLESLGAEYCGTIPLGISPKEGYRIDELGLQQRDHTAELSRPPARPVKKPILSVIVPIYNNGDYLINKCIASLRRSSIFDRMELILVDDGSTDTVTLEILDALERELNWAQIYRFEPGGSGSASRPRNKGLELASCDYVTYLDPDNEALNDGYVKLLRSVVQKGVDFAVGNMTRWRNRHSTVKYTKFLEARLSFSDAVALGGAEALVDMHFMPISIQAIVARTAWLRRTGISQPVGAVGQDSYFFQQMLYYASRFSIVPTVIHTYYAQVENSVVNTVNSRFFEKYLPLEHARSTWLTEVDLIDEYKRTRMEAFFTGWYLRKLADVPSEQRFRAVEIISELGTMYGDHEWTSLEAQEFWKYACEMGNDEDKGRIA